jgi:hypothetical protein
MIALWQRLPVIVRAAVTGGLAATLGMLPWARDVICDPRFLGTWEHRQAAGRGFDAEGERKVMIFHKGSW